MPFCSCGALGWRNSTARRAAALRPVARDLAPSAQRSRQATPSSMRSACSCNRIVGVARSSVGSTAIAASKRSRAAASSPAPSSAAPSMASGARGDRRQPRAPGAFRVLTRDSDERPSPAGFRRTRPARQRAPGRFRSRARSSAAASSLPRARAAAPEQRRLEAQAPARSRHPRRRVRVRCHLDRFCEIAQRRTPRDRRGDSGVPGSRRAAAR
jgi:hypothetical protein